MEWSVFLPLLQGLRMTEVCQGEASLLIQVIYERGTERIPQFIKPWRRRPSVSRKRFRPSVSRPLAVWLLGLRLAWESQPPG